MHPQIVSSEERLFAPRNVLGWTSFSLAAGSVNAAAFMACRSFVTHVTGTVTNLGVDAGNPTLAAEYGLVFGAFITGAMFSVMIVETLSKHRRQLVALPFLIVFLALIAVAVGGSYGMFGPFGANNTETAGAFVLLATLAGAMGVQNAAVALTTSNMIRTTHLTGPATDLAANVVRAVLGAGRGTRHESRWALLRVVKMLAFVAGAAVTARYAPRLEYQIFSVPAAFVILAVGFTFAPSDESEEEPAIRSEDASVPAEKAQPETQSDKAA
jgi:uncharacterized membrane protein YoaK (UPF0700 family)